MFIPDSRVDEGGSQEVLSLLSYPKLKKLRIVSLIIFNMVPSLLSGQLRISYIHSSVCVRIAFAVYSMLLLGLWGLLGARATL